MDSNQVLSLLDNYYDTLEKTGYIKDKETKVLLNVMFIDEYYEVHRDDETLTDCMVKSLNNRIDCLRKISCLFKGKFYDLANISHYVLQDEMKWYNLVLQGNNCKVYGAGTYQEDSDVTIICIPNEGYHFVKWSDNNENPVRTIHLDSSKILGAITAINI